jgi:hypothetical protein
VTEQQQWKEVLQWTCSCARTKPQSRVSVCMDEAMCVCVSPQMFMMTSCPSKCHERRTKGRTVAPNERSSSKNKSVSRSSQRGEDRGRSTCGLLLHAVQEHSFALLEHSLIIFETRFEYNLLHLRLLFIRNAFTNSTFEYK